MEDNPLVRRCLLEVPNKVVKGPSPMCPVPKYPKAGVIFLSTCSNTLHLPGQPSRQCGSVPFVELPLGDKPPHQVEKAETLPAERQQPDIFGWNTKQKEKEKLNFDVQFRAFGSLSPVDQPFQ